MSESVPNRANDPKRKVESAYDRARRLAGRDFYDRADYNRFVKTIPAGQKPHKHTFDVRDAEPASIDPNSRETYLPCGVDGCTAELHPQMEGPHEVHENGTVTPFKGKLLGLAEQAAEEEARRNRITYPKKKQ